MDHITIIYDIDSGCRPQEYENELLEGDPEDSCCYHIYVYICIYIYIYMLLRMVLLLCVIIIVNIIIISSSSSSVIIISIIEIVVIVAIICCFAESEAYNPFSPRMLTWSRISCESRCRIHRNGRQACVKQIILFKSMPNLCVCVYIYIYIYICAYKCVCICICLNLEDSLVRLGDREDVTKHTPKMSTYLGMGL